MSIQLSPDAGGQFPILVSPAANTNIDFARAALRHRFVDVLEALDTAIFAERDLSTAMDEEGRGLFDPALKALLKEAEERRQVVKDLLVDLETAAIAVPSTCSMRKMAQCLDQIIACDELGQFRKHFRFAELLAHTASVIPMRTTICRESALIVRAAMERWTGWRVCRSITSMRWDLTRALARSPAWKCIAFDPQRGPRGGPQPHLPKGQCLSARKPQQTAPHLSSPRISLMETFTSLTESQPLNTGSRRSGKRVLTSSNGSPIAT